mmetsp:Transcript_40132/g.88113  ORF Transcript_40132/g.88113 Transcript_40132/m.88113 type:complete len:322 (+) Transcript_40132:141-1106(+)
MLFADKLALENRTKVRLLLIRERELNLYVQNCRAVGTVAALLAGLAFSSLIYTKMDYFKNSTEVAKFFYCTGNTICMCMSLEIAMATTAITMLGPGLALRGPDGSMHSAVDGILVEFEQISRMFNGTILSFVVVVVTYAWTAAGVNWLCSIMITVLCMSIIFVMQVRTMVVETNFPLKSAPLISGAFFNEDVPSSPNRAPRQAAPCNASCEQRMLPQPAAASGSSRVSHADTPACERGRAAPPPQRAPALSAPGYSASSSLGSTASPAHGYARLDVEGGPNGAASSNDASPMLMADRAQQILPRFSRKSPKVDRTKYAQLP